MTKASAISLLMALSMATGSMRAVAIDPDIAQYGLGKTHGYVQTGAATVTANSYTFNVFVDRTAAGVLNGAVIQGPLSGFLGVHGPQNLTLNSRGADFESTVYLNLGALDSDFPNDSNGNYVLKIDTGGPASPDYSISLKLGGDAYVPDIPTLSANNGAWSGGTFYTDASNATTFSWTFSSYNAATDVVLFSVETLGGVRVVDQQFQGSNPGSFTLTELTAGTDYTGRLSFARIVDNPGGVPGVQGVAFYAMETSFNFTAVPEPSTYALLVLGLGFVALTLRRRSPR